MANLFESYKKRLQIAESVYSKANNGEKMSSNRKLVVAKCLDNISKFMNESFTASEGTQRADMGLWKKFCLNLTNVALPNLIANDLVIVSPMTSMSGYITYVQYTTSTKKGDTDAGVVLNDPFRLGAALPDYTSERVTESITDTSAAMTLAWTPVVTKAFDSDGQGTMKDVKIIASNGTVTYADLDSDGKVPASALVAGGKVAYVYDNVVVPQNNLPSIKAEIKSMPLLAKARRIAVYYSQIAAFQAKNDYGFDLGDQLAEKAVGELSYEIDTEIVQLLDNTAGTAQASLTWSKTLPVGVSKMEHYQGFTEIVEIARQIIYDRTKRFAPNYMVISSSVLPVLTFINGYSAAPAGQVNGPYFAGTLNGLRVYVSPSLTAGDFLVGVNGDDMMSSVAVYAPYMAIVPTQMLQYADGGTSQGWSTLYDLKVLNADLIVKGKITA